MLPNISIEEKQKILEKAEEWTARFYRVPVTAFLNVDLSAFQAGRYVIDVVEDFIEYSFCLETQFLSSSSSNSEESSYLALDKYLSVCTFLTKASANIHFCYTHN